MNLDLQKLNQSKSGEGFTLIETLIYLALFAIVIGGGMVAVYEIIQGSDASANQITLQEEANFLLRKIDWALTGATSVTTPSSTTLVVTKPIGGTSTQLTFTVTSNNLTLQRASGSALNLNSSSISVSNLSFIKTPGAGGKPDAIAANFTLTTIQNGRNVTQNFSTTKYLRK